MQLPFPLLERNQSLVDGIANNDRRVKEVEKARSKRAGLPRRKNFHSGAVEGCKTRVGGTKNARQARPAEEVPVIGRLMSRSKKRHLEWTFFLDENGRRQYNKLCKGCVHPCKQSFGMMTIVLPTLSFSLFSKVRELRLKTGEGTDQDGFFRDLLCDFIYEPAAPI